MYPAALNLDPAFLRPNPFNSNEVSPANEAKLEESLRRRGMFKPVVVREITFEGTLAYEILGGEHRAKTAVRIGMNPIPVFNLGPLDDKIAMEIGLLDNARYGADDLLSLQNILAEIGNVHELISFLPYSDTELQDIMVSSESLELDDLDLDETDEAGSESDEPDLPKAPRTHEVMRFKVAIADAERVRMRVAETQKRHGFTLADDLTNAGDALVQMLVVEPQSKLID